MSVLPIITGRDNPILRKKAVVVPKVTKDIARLVKDMIETTKNANGAGIAAPQVDRPERICIAMIQRKLTPLVNPQITWRSEETAVGEEGCLSLPDIWLNIPRSVEINVKYTDLKNKPVELRLKNMDARVVQHEVDHLEGKLIVDYVDFIPTPQLEHVAM